MMKQVILKLKIYCSQVIFKLCGVAQKNIRGLLTNVKNKKYIADILFVVFVVISTFVMFGYIFGRTEVYNLSNRIGSTEKQLKQYRDREESNIRNLEIANTKLKQFNKELEQYRTDVKTIRTENAAIRKQLNTSFKQIEESRKYSNRIGESINNQSISISSSGAILERIQSRGKISSFQK